MIYDPCYSVFKEVTTETKATEDRSKVLIRNIVVPVDGSEYSLNAAKYSATEDIDLIVIGTHGRTGLKRFFMGSVANVVIQHAHCPVYLVR